MGGECSQSREVVRELVKSIERFTSELAGLNETEKFLRFACWLNSELESRGIGRVVIVGGFAAELYSGRAYRTGDVDLIVEGEGAAELVKELLRELGELGLRIYLLKFPELSAKGIDIVAREYGYPKPPITVECSAGRVYIVPPEELIVSCLSAWKSWNSLEDRDKAYLVAAAQYERLDLGYLRARAREEGVEDLLDRVLKDLEELTA